MATLEPFIARHDPRGLAASRVTEGPTWTWRIRSHSLVLHCYSSDMVMQSALMCSQSVQFVIICQMDVSGLSGKHTAKGIERLRQCSTYSHIDMLLWLLFVCCYSLGFGISDCFSNCEIEETETHTRQKQPLSAAVLLAWILSAQTLTGLLALLQSINFCHIMRKLS